MQAPPPAVGTGWVQILLSVLGLLGGAGGVVAATTVLLQRRKFKADAAHVITNTALTLVEPLTKRVKELEAEATGARRETASAHREATAARHEAEAAKSEIADLRTALAELTRMAQRWRTAIFAPDASVDKLRVMVSAEPGGATNGRIR